MWTDHHARTTHGGVSCITSPTTRVTAMRSLLALPLLLAFGTAFPATAATPADGFWQTPTIHGYGKIHALPDAAYQPDPSQTYRIVFAVTKGVDSADKVNSGLDHVARTVNLYAASGVPLSQLKFVAVISGPATQSVLDNAHYRDKFGSDNPNLDLIAQLRKAGVDVAVCGQAVAEHQFDYSWVSRDVTLALSALTTVSTLEHQGYSLIQQ